MRSGKAEEDTGEESGIAMAAAMLITLAGSVMYTILEDMISKWSLTGY